MNLLEFGGFLGGGKGMILPSYKQNQQELGFFDLIKTWGLKNNFARIVFSKPAQKSLIAYDCATTQKKSILMVVGFPSSHFLDTE